MVKERIFISPKKSSMYLVALGQCSKAMKAKLESNSQFESINEDNDLIHLLNLIQDVSYAYKSKQYPYLSVYNGVRSMYSNYQNNYATVDSYLESFQNMNQVVEHCGGNFGTHPLLVQNILTKNGVTSPTNTQKAEAEDKLKEAYLAITFLCGLNREKYQDLLDDLSHLFITGKDIYPKLVVEAHSLVLHWKNKKSGPRQRIGDGINFNTIGEEDSDGEAVNVTQGGVIRKKNGQPVKCLQPLSVGLPAETTKCRVIKCYCNCQHS